MRQLLLTGILAIGLLGCGSEGNQGTEEAGTDTPAEVQNEAMQALVDQYATVRLTTDVSQLSEASKQMIPLLIEAGEIMNGLFAYEAFGDLESLLEAAPVDAAK